MPHIELHLHTKAGSADSSISVDALGERAAELETGGLLVTEHWRVWTEGERALFEDRWGIRLYPAIEATTDAGHFLVLGAEPGETLPHPFDLAGCRNRPRSQAAHWIQSEDWGP